jgi:hypothetical protein
MCRSLPQKDRIPWKMAMGPFQLSPGLGGDNASALPRSLSNTLQQAHRGLSLEILFTLEVYG